MRTACVSISFAFTYRNSQILFPLDHLDGSFPCDDPFIILLGTRFCSCYGTEHYIKEGLRGSLMIGSWRIVYPLWCSLGAIVVLDYNRNTCFLYFKKNTTPPHSPLHVFFFLNWCVAFYLFQQYEGRPVRLVLSQFVFYYIAVDSEQPWGKSRFYLNFFFDIAAYIFKNT